MEAMRSWRCRCLPSRSSVFLNRLMMSSTSRVTSSTPNEEDLPFLEKNLNTPSSSCSYSPNTGSAILNCFSSSADLHVFFALTMGTSLFLKRNSNLSARVGRSLLFAYLTAALLAIASKNCLCSTTFYAWWMSSASTENMFFSDSASSSSSSSNDSSCSSFFIILSSILRSFLSMGSFFASVSGAGPPSWAFNSSFWGCMMLNFYLSLLPSNVKWFFLPWKYTRSN
mmetsp:Transcript_5187/g.3883  ORF Transcript_5187/g.3883 Transcript_5187/m.3883 type:complete len:226 (-) Transcript_5187:267-944(-)